MTNVPQRRECTLCLGMGTQNPQRAAVGAEFVLVTELALPPAAETKGQLREEQGRSHMVTPDSWLVCKVSL